MRKPDTTNLKRAGCSVVTQPWPSRVFDLSLGSYTFDVCGVTRGFRTATGLSDSASQSPTATLCGMSSALEDRRRGVRAWSWPHARLAEGARVRGLRSDFGGPRATGGGRSRTHAAQGSSSKVPSGIGSVGSWPVVCCVSDPRILRKRRRGRHRSKTRRRRATGAVRHVQSVLRVPRRLFFNVSSRTPHFPYFAIQSSLSCCSCRAREPCGQVYVRAGSGIWESGPSNADAVRATLFRSSHWAVALELLLPRRSDGITMGGHIMSCLQHTDAPVDSSHLWQEPIDYQSMGFVNCYS